MRIGLSTIRVLVSIITLCLLSIAEAGAPLWSFTALTATTLSIPANDTATVQYQITNQSQKAHKLNMLPISGVTQLTGGFGVCSNPFILSGKASCTLSIQINGSQLTKPIVQGPVVCEQGSKLQCYGPASADTLHITPIAPISSATITVTGSPLTLLTNGPTGVLTINNTSLTTAATNVTSNFTGTALDGNVTETGNTCASIAPQASCTLTYTPGSTVVPQTSFPIQGSNTNVINAAIQIDPSTTLTNVSPSSGPASGGTGVTLTGTGFVGATSVTFGGTPATSINVVNSTTVTAVTPAHAIGAVDVTITTPGGSATATNGYTYLTTVVGASAYGGTIACMNGGLNDLIAATVDNSQGISWGGVGVTTTATDTTDGATNTATIVAALGNNGGTPYAAQLCDNYEIDSQGNTTCQPGNACYNDWFLPAGDNTSPTGQLNCLYLNQVAIGGFSSVIYWSSTESDANNATAQFFAGGGEQDFTKNLALNVRCVRAFTP